MDSLNGIPRQLSCTVSITATLRAAALFFYRHGSGYDQITQALKYGRNFAAGRHFAAMLGQRLRDSPLFSDVDLVVPVPLHWTRRVRRGYNQAEVIARAVARELSAGRGGEPRDPGCSHRTPSQPGALPPARVAFAPRLLRRVRRTRTQTRMTISEKSLNVSGAFAVRSVHTLTDSGGGMCKKGLKRTYPRLFSGGYARDVHHILLVDDVFTTGSTLTACHDALREVFGPDVRISLATLSFAG